jgi:hypothetical protein
LGLSFFQRPGRALPQRLLGLGTLRQLLRVSSEQGLRRFQPQLGRTRQHTAAAAAITITTIITTTTKTAAAATARPTSSLLVRRQVHVGMQKGVFCYCQLRFCGFRPQLQLSFLQRRFVSGSRSRLRGRHLRFKQLCAQGLKFKLQRLRSTRHVFNLRPEPLDLLLKLGRLFAKRKK